MAIENIGMKLKDINFFPKSLEAEILVDKPEPSRNFIPVWYKKLHAFENNKFSINEHGESNATAKMCVPFSDAFSMGYIQKLWADIYIEDRSDGVYYSSSSQYAPISHRDNLSGIPIDNSYYPYEFVWKMQWIPKLPDGYSILYTHPFNRTDLPFYSLTGIVDADKFYHEGQGNHPFYIKKGFTGKIPYGTPIVQIIPFKRDSWKSMFEEFDEKNKIIPQLLKKQFYGVYKKLFWSKKEFL